jgi:hypothetical protein
MRPLRDDVRVSASFVGVGGEGFVGNEVPIAFYGEAELAADGRQLRECNVSQFRATKAKIAETEGETTVRVKLS